MADITREQIQKLTIQQIDDLTAMIADVRRETSIALRQDTKSKILDLARAAGVELADLFGFSGSADDKPKRTYIRKGEGGTKTPSAPVAPKYRHPENDTVTWSGRGRKPQWFLDYIANAGKEEDILIKK